MAEISVVIPTYYRNERLIKSIESVKNQSYESIEIIVVDDSGESHAKPVVKEYPHVEYIEHQVNRGSQAARTTGIDQACGRYIQLLDDDDILHPEKLRKQSCLLDENDHLGVVYSGFCWKNRRAVYPKQEIKGNVLRKALMFDTSPCVTSTMLLRRDVLEQIVPLQDRPGADDTGMKIELAKLTEFDYIDEILVFRSDLPDSRQSSTGKIIGQIQILDEYSSLYSQFPPEVYKSALAETYLILGLNLLNKEIWSFDAVYYIAKACCLKPGISTTYIGALISSLFGRPGRDVAILIFQLLRGKKRKGKLT